MNPVPFVAVALLLCASFHVAAQKVYRCGPDGRSYQQTPCAEGKAIDVSAPRTAEQRQAAQSAAQSDAKAGAKFERDTAPPPPTKSGKTRPATASTATDKAAGSAKEASKK